MGLEEKTSLPSNTESKKNALLNKLSAAADDEALKQRAWGELQENRERQQRDTEIEESLRAQVRAFESQMEGTVAKLSCSNKDWDKITT